MSGKTGANIGAEQAGRAKRTKAETRLSASSAPDAGVVGARSALAGERLGERLGEGIGEAASDVASPALPGHSVMRATLEKALDGAATDRADRSTRPVGKPFAAHRTRDLRAGEAKETVHAEHGSDALPASSARSTGPKRANGAGAVAARRQVWHVPGLDCASSGQKVTARLANQAQIRNLAYDFQSQALAFDVAAGRKLPDLAQTLAELGYAPQQLEEAAARAHPLYRPLPEQDAGLRAAVVGGGRKTLRAQRAPWLEDRASRLLVVVLAALLVILGLQVLGDTRVWPFVAVAATGAAALLFAKNAAVGLSQGRVLSFDVLAPLSGGAGLAAGAFAEAVIVMALALMGETVARRLRAEGRRGHLGQERLLPHHALLETERGQLRDVLAKTLQPGQLVKVRVGDRIPADGTVVDGAAGVDESLITGGLTLQPRGPGDAVYAGASCVSGVLRVRVTKPAADATLARLLTVIERADTARGAERQRIERLAQAYVPLVIFLVVGVFLTGPNLFGGDWEAARERALIVLLAAFPAAILLVTPTVYTTTLAVAGRRGLLVKSAAVLERLARVGIVGLDKAGTLTLGTPIVTDIVPVNDTVSQDELVSLAAAVEESSSHPLAKAILREARSRGAARKRAHGQEPLVGRGVHALIGRKEAHVVSPTYARHMGIMPAALTGRADALEAEGKTVVVVALDGHVKGVIALFDDLRTDALEAVEDLKLLEVRPVMLTADNLLAAEATAGPLGIEYQAALSPRDKLRAVNNLRAEGPVMMVGDGVQDAAALRGADVGVAMGGGSDIALEAADAVIVHNRLNDTGALVRLGRRAVRVIRQTWALALIWKLVTLGAFLAGHIGAFELIASEVVLAFVGLVWVALCRAGEAKA